MNGLVKTTKKFSAPLPIAKENSRTMVKINSKAKPATNLPVGWTVITTTRKRGKSKGQRDKTFFSPSSERFRSYVAVKRHLAELEALQNATPSNEADNVVLVVDSSSDEENDSDTDEDSLWL